MTNSEFSDEFDVLLNSYFGSNTGSSFTLNEYEKSVFLTEAQEDLVVGLYNGTIVGIPFEQTEELRRYLDSLVKSVSLTSNGSVSLLGNPVFNLPEDILFITLERAKIQSEDCHNGSTLLVVPVTQDEYQKIILNPFRRPNYRRVLRLDCGDNKVELSSIYAIDTYIVRYLSRPNPIILTNLPEDLDIRTEHLSRECSLNPILHRTLLRMAVDKAIRVKSIGVQSK